MNRFPLRLKITLWFSTVLIILVALTCGVILYINDFMIQKVIQDNLIEIVENDVDEIEYFPSIQDKENDYDLDVYLSFRNGYLEIDDDFGISGKRFLTIWRKSPLSRTFRYEIFGFTNPNQKRKRSYMVYL